MQPERPVKLTPSTKSSRGGCEGIILSLISGFCGILVLSATIATGTSRRVYEDADAGIRMTIPFAQSEQKSAAQVDALLNAEAKVPMPRGVVVSGGIYDASGLPFILVCKKGGASAPTQRDVKDLASFEGPWSFVVKPFRALAPSLKGIPDDFRFDLARLKGRAYLPERGGFKSQVMMQLTTEGAAFAGFYYRDDADQALADEAFESLSPLPGRSLDYRGLAPGSLALATKLGIVSALLLAALLVVVRRLSVRAR